MKKKQSGFALVLSLVLLLVMSLMGGVLIVVASSDHSKNTASDRYMQTFYVAETALLEGERYIVNKFKGDWTEGATRDVTNRTLPTNTGTNWDGAMIEVNYNDGTEFFDTDTENARLCWNSFKDPNRENFQIITAHSNNFGKFFEDSLDPSEINNLDINIDELKRYYYEYFISNVGSQSMAFYTRRYCFWSFNL